MDRPRENGYKHIYKDIAKVDANGMTYTETVGMYVPMSNAEIEMRDKIDKQVGGCLLSIFGIWFVYRVIRLVYRFVTGSDSIFE